MPQGQAKPRMWIASSTEGVRFAESILVILADTVLSTLWRYGTFDPGQYPVDAIQRMANESNYGTFILTPDDTATVRASEVVIPRDNVLLELGMFLTRLGRESCFIVTPNDVSNLRLPSDLRGVTEIRYSHSDLSLSRAAVATNVAAQIRDAIEKLASAKQSSDLSSTVSSTPTSVLTELGATSDAELTPLDGDAIGRLSMSAPVREFDSMCERFRESKLGQVPAGKPKVIADRLQLSGLSTAEEVTKAMWEHASRWKCFLKTYNERARVKGRACFPGVSLELFAEFYVLVNDPEALATFYRSAGIASNPANATEVAQRVIDEAYAPCQPASERARSGA